MTRFFSSMVIFFSLALSLAFCGCKDPCEVYDSFDVPRGASFFFISARERSEGSRMCSVCE